MQGRCELAKAAFSGPPQVNLSEPTQVSFYDGF